MTLSRLIHICARRLRSLFRRERLDDELDRELTFHREQLELENLEAGMSAEEAKTEARRALGNLAKFKEECRDERRVSWLYDFSQDVRYGLRMMRKHPGFTALASLALALAIGGNAAVLNIGTSLLWGRLPVPDDGRVVVVQSFAARNPLFGGPASVPDYVAWRDNNTVFESIGTSIASTQDLAGDQRNPLPERIAGQAVTPSLFHVLRVQPRLGRVFREDESPLDSAAAPVVILSHQLWQRRFGGDIGIVGREIRMNGRRLQVIGVMPRGFFYPNENSDFWVPLTFTRFQLQASASLFMVTARLKPATTMRDVQLDLRRIAAQNPSGQAARAIPLRQQWFSWMQGPLELLESALILVLVVACANVSTLLLARVPARQPEIIMRLLLGAGRGRIVRQFLTESLLLSLIGGTMGVFIAKWGVTRLESLPHTPGGISIAGMGLNAGIFGYAVLLSILSTLLFGFLPSVVAFSSANDARQATAHRKPGNLSSILVAAQVGLALMLLASSGLLLNSLVRLLLDDRGFDPSGVITFQYRVPVGDYLRGLGSYRGLPSADIEPPTQLMQRVYERLRALPGADSVAGASAPPVNGIVPPTAVLQVEGRPPESTYYFLVTDNFFATLKTPVLQGRDFNRSDTSSTPWVAVINRTLAERLWPGENPLGKHFTVDAKSGERSREVIGVVQDVPLRFIRTGPPQAVAYSLYLQQPERYEGLNAGSFGQMNFFIRSHEDRESLVSAARRAVAEVDPSRPISNIQTMSDFVGDTMKTRSYYVSALSAFAFMATLLAAAGIYGTMSSAVSQRTREIGIRIAMGATASDILKLVGARAFRLVTVGLLAGLAITLACARMLAPLLWGITPTDPATFVGVILLLVGVSAVACFLPVRQAMRVEPTEALRMD